MKNLFLLTICILTYLTTTAQVTYKEFYSTRLDDTRKLKIQLPRNYDPNGNRTYPIVLVLDGDYLFEPVAGNVDYFSYWEDMPEAIVVGIMQGNQRYDDTFYDTQNFMPTESGANFFEFIGLELIPHLDKNYRTAKFIIAVGHDVTANFLHYYLFKSPVLFNGFVILSPDLSPSMDEWLANRIPNINEKIFYYLATGSDDVRSLKESTEILDRKLNPLKNENFNYYFDNFEDANHYSLVARGIPNALEKLFSIYRPISQKEYTEVLMTTNTPLYDYLLDKYAAIKDLFEIDNPIRINDFLAVGTAAEKRKQWNALNDLGRLAKQQYPNKVLGSYFLGRYYEETGNLRRAMQEFRGAYDKEEVDFITIDLLLDRADDIKHSQN